ncbi:MAG: DNA-processing protein DprA [Duncaniella sp.]|nr:DNA-processing protein DprA [Duncaniella sp.]
MNDSHLIYKIAFASLRSLTVEAARLILDCVGTEERFFEMSEVELRPLLGLRRRIYADDVRSRALAEARREIEFVRANRIRTLYFADPDYPRRLLECPDAPLMLYMIGDTDLNAARILSIVGTRHATAYGTTFVTSLLRDLRERMADPLVVVSGLAYGIDVAAHRGSLAEGIPTVGVLAHGLNTIYPASHRDTAVRMVRDGGALLTDYRSIDATHKGNFLARNRIVAGLADALLVAESDTRGGAMVTARLAAAYSREVLALPGRIGDRYSRGCNKLIADNGAALVTSATDLMRLMGWPERPQEGAQTELFPTLSPEEESIVEVIRETGEATLSHMLATLDIPVHRLMSTLVDLEMRRVVISLPGSNYRLL